MVDVPNYLELARVLQGKLRDRIASDSTTKWQELLEFAATTFDVQKGKFVHSRKRSKTLRREEDKRNVGGEEQVCQHVYCEHEEAMNPKCWSTLPLELLQLIFARLPVNKILDLQCVSKDWKESLGARGDFGFLRACDEAHPKMFALISKVIECEGPTNLFLVRVFDTKLNAWHAFQLSVGVPEMNWPVKHLQPQWRPMSCEDGGLVLFVMEGHRVPKENGSICSFFFKVMNPLIGYAYDLPPIVNVQNVLMQHIIVDYEMNCYEVLIEVDRGGTTTKDIQVFHPKIGQWSQPSEAKNIMFGNQLAYDFVMGSFGIGQGPWHKEKVSSFAFFKNHVFVLFKDTNVSSNEVCTKRPRKRYCIKEYVMEYHPQLLPTWIEVDVHKCVPLENTPKKKNYRWKLLASNGFLVVFVTLTELKPWHNDKRWLYDLSTRTWRDLPKLPGDEYMWIEEDRICEIRWNTHSN